MNSLSERTCVHYDNDDDYGEDVNCDEGDIDDDDDDN